MRTIAACLLFISVPAFAAKPATKSATHQKTESVTAVQETVAPEAGDELGSFAVDRMDTALSAETLNPGHVQAELSAFRYSFNKIAAFPGTTFKMYSVGLITAKAGLAKNLEADVMFTPYTKIIGGGSGNSDLFFGAKWAVFHQDKVRLSLMPNLSLPVSKAGFGSTTLQGGIAAPLQIALEDEWMVQSTLAGDIVADALVVTGTAAPVKRITDNLDAFMGTSVSKSLATGGAWAANIGAGAGYNFTRNIRVQASATAGLLDVMPDLTTSVGGAFRL